MTPVLPFRFLYRIRWVIALALISVVFFALPAGIFLYLIWPGSCEFEQFADSPHLQIPGTSWVVDEWGQACGFGVSGGMEIRAKNSVTEVSKTIVEFNDIVVGVMLTTDGPRNLTITMPNRVDFDEVGLPIPDLTIAYRFTPKDDPDDRASYRRWHRNPRDPIAREWYCQAILAKAPDRESRNRILGEMFESNSSPTKLYCPNQ